jgi:hypothetical protein
MTRLAVLMAVATVTVAGLAETLQAATRQTSQLVDPCAAVGEGRFRSANASGCEGFWNIFASIPQGDVWWFENKNGDDAKSAAIQARIDREAEAVRAKLDRCGIASYVTLSDWFDNLRGDLVVVHSKPHPSTKDAATELAKARACGINGYTKFSPYQITGRD